MTILSGSQTFFFIFSVVQGVELRKDKHELGQFSIGSASGVYQ